MEHLINTDNAKTATVELNLVDAVPSEKVGNESSGTKSLVSHAQNDFRDFSDIISTSQPLNLHRDSEVRLPATQGNALCSTCCRTFKTTRGLNQHRRNCQQNWKNVTKQTNTVLTSSEITDNPILNQEVNEVEQPETFFVKIERLYEELVYWKRNLFEIPTGNAGKEFINELTSYVNGVLTLQTVLLQLKSS